MSGLDKRGGYTPRRVREQRAYRLVVGGSTAGAIGIVSLVLAIAGLIGYALPVIALIVAAICMFSFRGMTRPR
jgi:CHASE2 domain-containing sensor protein